MSATKRCFSNPDTLYVQGSRSVLKICKKTRQLSVIDSQTQDYIDCQTDPHSYAGDISLILGLIEAEGSSYLIYVKQASQVAKFYEKEETAPIYRIDRIDALPILDDGLAIKLDSFVPLPAKGGSLAGKAALQAKNNIRLGQKQLLKFVRDKIPGSIPHFIDEILRLFNDVPDFYFCYERDITHTTQRHFEKTKTPDERFFWNSHLLKDILSSPGEAAKDWIVPVMQGHVQSKEIKIDDVEASIPYLSLTLISRRSIHRAGARYLRRGIDQDGNVANFVESELVLYMFGHHVSFVQIRGSIPMFWSQKGYHYRPPLVIGKPVEESMPFYEKHMENLQAHYGKPIVMVNLVNQTGRELELARCYLEHVLRQNSEDTEFFSFDFHHHCRGLNFEKVALLLSSLEDSLGKLGFCWVDKTGEVVRRQNGTVRTNCIDCLDRTNVVQCTISQYVCFGQARRLGLFGVANEPPEELIPALQLLWADNGDSISTQYAGTAALKGDMTRFGERKLTGMMKDGYNSASRYYLSHMRDARRQAAMNSLLGNKEDEGRGLGIGPEEAANVGRLVTETANYLLPENEVLVGGWALVDYQSGDDQCDTILMLTRASLYVATYDEDSEKVLDLKILPLDDISRVELGCAGRSPRTHIRIVSVEGAWIFRAGRTRLFNNVPIRIKSPEEADEYIESVAEQIRITIENALDMTIEVVHVDRIPTGQDGAKKKFATMLGMFARRQQSTAANETREVSGPPRSRGLISKIKGLQSTTNREAQSPFAELQERIDACRSKIVLL
ncbi:unnamed protein product, partial [Mesorhabditis spiculigera]